MSEIESVAAEAQNDSDDQEIDLTDQGSQSTVASKRKGGRPDGDAWDTFKKVPNPLHCWRNTGPDDLLDW